MTSTTAARPLPAWLKAALLSLLVFAVCWGGAIAWWRSTDSAPATSELVLMLLALPCGVLLAFKLGKKRMLSRPAAATAGASPAAQPLAAAPTAPPLAILATALRSPHGASAAELVAAIAEDKARPDLDPELVDDDGFPVMSARSSDAVDEAVQEEITGWLAQQGMAELHLREAQWRALLLGTLVVRDLAAHAVSELMTSEGAAPALRLIPLLPKDWTLEQGRAAGLWFSHTVAGFGWPGAGIGAIDLPGAAGQPAAVLARLALDSRAGDGRLAAIVIACDSAIDQETVDTWAANGTLFTPTRAQGLVPGEGAAGLLLTGLQGARQSEGAVFAQLHPMLEARRAASLDEARRVEPTLLADLSERAATAAGLALSDIGTIAADTDQRTKRGVELMGLASSALPQLDGPLDVMRVGIASGACGAVPRMSALALAAQRALDIGTPALFISNDDALACHAALVCPPPPAADPAPA